MIGIIDYNAGNVKSVERALDALGCEYVRATSPQALDAASKLIFPGVGDAQYALILERIDEDVDVSIGIPHIGAILLRITTIAHEETAIEGRLIDFMAVYARLFHEIALGVVYRHHKLEAEVYATLGIEFVHFSDELCQMAFDDILLLVALLII